MNRWMPAVLVLVCAALAAAVAVQAARLRRVQREANQLVSRIERLESRQKESTAATREAVEKIQEQVAVVEKEVASKPRPSAEAAAPAPAGIPALATEADLRKLVDEKVEERLKAQAEKQGAGGDRKMPLHDLSKELGLAPPLQPRVAEIANAAKKEIFDLLRIPRPDGTNIADELLDSFLSGDQARVQQTFLRVFNEKVPGTEMTYLIGAGKVQEKAYQGLEQVMGSEAFARFKHMNVHPENIETGYDPWGEYLQQRNPR